MTITTMDELVSCVVLLALLLFALACVVADLYKRVKQLQEDFIIHQITKAIDASKSVTRNPESEL